MSETKTECLLFSRSTLAIGDTYGQIHEILAVIPLLLSESDVVELQGNICFLYPDQICLLQCSSSQAFNIVISVLTILLDRIVLSRHVFLVQGRSVSSIKDFSTPCIIDGIAPADIVTKIVHSNYNQDESRNKKDTHQEIDFQISLPESKDQIQLWVRLLKCKLIYTKSSKYLNRYNNLRQSKPGPTCLPSIHSLLALNLAGANSQTVLLDPFVGSQTIPRLARLAQQSAYSIGTDVYLQKDAYVTSDGLDLIIGDSSTPFWRAGSGPANIVDVIVTDLPYNIRANVVGHDVYGSTIQSSLSLFQSVLKLAANALCPQGRLCFWYLDLAEKNICLEKQLCEYLESPLKNSIRFQFRISDKRSPFARCLWVFKKEGTVELLNNKKKPILFKPSGMVHTINDKFMDPAKPGSIFEMVRKGDLIELQNYCRLKPLPPIHSLIDKKGKGVLAYAAGYGRDKLISVLIRKIGCLPNERIPSAHNQTCLFFSARFGHLKSVKVLIQEGADPNLRDDQQNTILSIASMFGHINVVDYLTQHVSFDVHDIHQAILAACRFDHHETIFNLLSLLSKTERQPTAPFLLECLNELAKWGHLKSLMTFKPFLHQSLLEMSFPLEKGKKNWFHQAVYFSRLEWIKTIKLEFPDAFQLFSMMKDENGMIPIEKASNPEIRRLLSS